MLVSAFRAHPNRWHQPSEGHHGGKTMRINRIKINQSPVHPTSLSVCNGLNKIIATC